MTDDSVGYPRSGKEFAGHGIVDHSIEEYVCGTFWHTNMSKSYFAILKRGISGVYHHVSEAHLKRYVGEFDFRYNTHKETDIQGAELAAAGIVGKSLPIGGLTKLQTLKAEGDGIQEVEKTPR